MKSFTVKYQYIVNHYGTVEVEAENINAAKDKVLGGNVRDEYEWSNSTEFDFLDVFETPPEPEETPVNEN
jgi:hypothetical protein